MVVVGGDGVASRGEALGVGVGPGALQCVLDGVQDVCGCGQAVGGGVAQVQADDGAALVFEGVGELRQGAAQTVRKTGQAVGRLDHRGSIGVGGSACPAAEDSRRRAGVQRCASGLMKRRGT